MTNIAQTIQQRRLYEDRVLVAQQRVDAAKQNAEESARRLELAEDDLESSEQNLREYRLKEQDWVFEIDRTPVTESPTDVVPSEEPDEEASATVAK